MSDLISKIRSRGYWDVQVRPSVFLPDRVPYDQLDEIIPSIAVRMRGWPVPYADYGRDQVIRGDDWVGQDIDADIVDHYEAWRFFTSGQFSHLRGLSADWRSGTEAPRKPSGVEAIIEVWEILFYLTELFELAARLALGPAGDDTMVISAKLANLGKRALVVGQRNREEFWEPHIASSDSLQFTVKKPREGLVAEPGAVAAEMAREFFFRFGWKPSLSQLLDHQRELTERR